MSEQGAGKQPSHTAALVRFQPRWTLDPVVIGSDVVHSTARGNF
jgi:hypothetical protein